MPKNLSDILKGVNKSSTAALTTGDIPDVDYAAKMKDTRDFVAKHSVEKHADRVGNDETVYKGATKKAKMERHGHEPKPKDVQVYNKTNQATNEETDIDEKYQGFEKTERALAAKGAKDPGALAAWIGRKKYGKEKFQKAAAAGKKLKEAKDEGEYGYEGEMAISQIKSIMNHSKQLMSVLKPNTDLPEWVQSKITLASDYIQTAADYLSTEMSEAKMCETCGKSPCGCDADDMPKKMSKKGKKLLLEPQVNEMATSQNQAIAARIALKHKKEGTMPPKGTASHSMMDMTTKQLHDYTHAKKGAPKKVEEALSDQRSAKATASEKAREKITAALEKRKLATMKMKEQAAPVETPITFPALNSREGMGRI